jgi:hypothetical protein
MSLMNPVLLAASMCQTSQVFHSGLNSAPHVKRLGHKGDIHPLAVTFNHCIGVFDQVLRIYDSRFLAGNLLNYLVHLELRLVARFCKREVWVELVVGDQRDSRIADDECIFKDAQKILIHP